VTVTSTAITSFIILSFPSWFPRFFFQSFIFSVCLFSLCPLFFLFSSELFSVFFLSCFVLPLHFSFFFVILCLHCSPFPNDFFPSTPPPSSSPVHLSIRVQFTPSDPFQVLGSPLSLLFLSVLPPDAVLCVSFPVCFLCVRSAASSSILFLPVSPAFFFFDLSLCSLAPSFFL